MFERRIPEWLRHAPAPSVRGFAILAGCEAVVRGMLVSVFPVAMLAALGDAARISSVYFMIGIVSLMAGLLVPFLNRFIPRRWMYVIGCFCYIAGCSSAMVGTPALTVLALALNSIATVTTFVCFNSYVLDYIARIELGRCETQRLFYSALGWTIGPFAGVILWDWWHPAPFIISASAAGVMLLVFTYMRMGNGKLITKAKRPPPNPVAYLGRFFRQPRLVAGWLFAVIRSCGWWAYIVYLPIYAVGNGMGAQLGGAVMSTTNAALFLTPFMLRWIQARSIRQSVRTGFATCAVLFGIAGLGITSPWVTIALLVAASFFLILLDICGGLPFLMAVKPSERTEMSAVYSSYRDVSGIATPGGAWLVLLVAPVTGVFALAGAGCVVALLLTAKLHPRLGEARLKPDNELNGPLAAGKPA
ncbi:MFS transporter [Sulfitobacter guttiformis]|uniref:Putative MFS family arabinose efflux permease n=1 Tax=Sulfitobacter guttiformis TaxID=74349 RepID=A0A420DMT6_9RHOB|nr:MFS transporter [Sulfitobacter guttiformis]KIN72862.1 Transporter, major facilitator family [Sulfitobacter guttiformis KCTC 32187]RKE95552.1 putative MFS family arabinose efflux permease [Sulfitobacter guttiformis]